VENGEGAGSVGVAGGRLAAVVLDAVADGDLLEDEVGGWRSKLLAWGC
jgi:hypothetical protein